MCVYVSAWHLSTCRFIVYVANLYANSDRYGDSIQALTEIGCLYNGIDRMQDMHIGSHSTVIRLYSSHCWMLLMHLATSLSLSDQLHLNLFRSHKCISRTDNIRHMSMYTNAPTAFKFNKPPPYMLVGSTEIRLCVMKCVSSRRPGKS